MAIILAGPTKQPFSNTTVLMCIGMLVYVLSQVHVMNSVLTIIRTPSGTH